MEQKNSANNLGFGRYLKPHALSRSLNEWGKLNCGDKKDELFRINPDFDDRYPLQVTYVVTKNGDCLDVYWGREIICRKDFTGERNKIETITKQLAIAEQDAFVDEWYNQVYEYIDDLRPREDAAVNEYVDKLQETLISVANPILHTIETSGYYDVIDADESPSGSGGSGEINIDAKPVLPIEYPEYLPQIDPETLKKLLAELLRDRLIYPADNGGYMVKSMRHFVERCASKGYIKSKKQKDNDRIDAHFIKAYIKTNCSFETIRQYISRERPLA